ncbi:MAG: hypothetical protein HPZ91_00600 [Lentisphaeria bacterium]|nr:hypothetical protein [Lentisphaeria bacterium]MBS1368429.1 hypothetical protein [Lentisphaeria bacterium]
MKTSIFLFLLLTCTISNGIEIKRAFGFELGQTYNIKPNTQIMFYPIPIKKVKEPFRKFNRYDISVNTDQRIFLIRAEYQAPNIQEAIREIKIIEKALEKKYKVKPTPRENDNKAIYFCGLEGNNQRSIGIVRDKKLIRIMYRDNKLGEDQDKTEELQEEKKIREEIEESNMNAL